MADIEHVRALENRIEQLEDLRNVSTNNDFYERLAAGKPTNAGSASPATLQYIPVPITLKAQLGSPTALAIGAFATTLTTLSLALMEFRGLTVTNAFIGDFFVRGIVTSHRATVSNCWTLPYAIWIYCSQFHTQGVC